MTSDEGLKPEGAPERSPKAGVGAPSGVDGNGPKRFSVQRKMAIVARLLRGEPLDLVARQTTVLVAKLIEWRDRALAGAATALKERERAKSGLNGTGNFGSHNREFSAKNREFSRLSSNGDGRDNQKWPLTGADEIFGSDNCRDARHEHRSNISDQNFTHGGSASA